MKALWVKMRRNGLAAIAVAASVMAAPVSAEAPDYAAEWLGRSDEARVEVVTAVIEAKRRQFERQKNDDRIENRTIAVAFLTCFSEKPLDTASIEALSAGLTQHYGRPNTACASPDHYVGMALLNRCKSQLQAELQRAGLPEPTTWSVKCG